MKVPAPHAQASRWLCSRRKPDEKYARAGKGDPAKRAGHFVQIIVLEHAGPGIWGDIDDTVNVEAWERKGDGLISAHWIPTA